MAVMPRSRLTTLIVAVLLASFACTPPAGLPFFPTPTPTVTSTPTPTATPTPTPTPIPAVYLDAASRALFYGDWDQAIAEVQTALTWAGDAAAQGEAQLGLGDALLRAGRLAEAVEALTQFVDRFPAHERLAHGFFLRARARQALGQLDAAIQDFDQYLALRPGRLDSYVQEQVGDSLRQLSRPAEAIGRYQAAMAAPRRGGTLDLEISIGHAYSEAGDPAAALAQFDRVYQLSTDPATRAGMNLLAGLALESMGDYPGAYVRYMDSVVNFPEVQDSYTGLIRLVDVGVAVDEFQRGLVDYNAGAHEPALAAFDRALASAPTGTGYYYRALSRRALGDYWGALSDFGEVIAGYPDDPHWADAWLDQARTQWAYLDLYPEAIQTYLDFVAAAPASPAAADALFGAGRTAERSGDLASAAEIWLRLASEYSASSLAHQAAFEAGIARYRSFDFEGARLAFELADSLATESGDHAAARLWVGKARLALGDAAGAQVDWRMATVADPTGYYSVRAGQLLAGHQPFQSQGVFDFTTDPEAERQEAEAWLRATFPVTGPDPLTDLTPELAADSRVVRGTEFWALGMYGEAKAEFESLRREAENDAETSYRLMHTLLDLGLYQPAIFAARQILDLAGMDDAATMNAPVYFNRIRFGPYFGDLILPEAANNSLDGLLMLSVVRQESLFEGFATSYAAARGLMQVIPGTGQEIADALGWPPGYTTDDLYRPVVSVRFGAYYLAAQRDAFDGDLYAALAAYNAGPGNAAAWQAIAQGDPDLFLEVIRLTEPHRYIRSIVEIFAIYSRLYVTP